MKWASAISTQPDCATGVEECTSALREELGAEVPDLILAFVSTHYKADYGRIAALVRKEFPGGVFCGCTAMGIIGDGKEREQTPGISLVGACLPGVDVRLVVTDTLDLPDEDEAPAAWREWLGLGPDEDYHFMMLADPFSVAIEPLLAGLDFAYPDTKKLGGLASGGGKPRENVLWAGEQTYREGLVAVALSGNLEIDMVVAQGCRPIGEAKTITCCNGTLMLELDGSPPVTYLKKLRSQLDAEDQQLMTTSLFLGLEMDPFNDRPERGDFLVRNLLGIDYEAGSISVGANLHEGQVVQFQLRDKRTSKEDLLRQINTHGEREHLSDAAGALLFACIGRGEFLYGEPDHDSRLFLDRVGEVPLGGFFSNGEIGPVGGVTFVHGYTSVFALFRSK